MMRYLNTFLVLIASTLMLTSCFSYKEIELGDVTDVKLNRAANGGVEVQAAMHVKNPNNYKIKIKKIEADMFVNGKNVGKMQLSKKVVLPKKSDQVQTFAVNTQLSNLLSAMPSVLFGGDINLKLKGFIWGKVFIFRQKFPLEAEEKIDAKDLKLF